jgi:hypothetical protein
MLPKGSGFVKVDPMESLGILRGRVFETFIGIATTALGIIVTALGADAKTHRGAFLTIGALLTACGGVLISWIVSRAYARDEAKREFGSQLGYLSRNLGQAAGQIARAVEQAQARDIDAGTGFALVSLANRMVYGQVNEIAVIQGAGFDPAYLLETASKLDNLARELETQQTDDGKPDALASVRRELANVRTTLSRGPVGRTFSTAAALCPYCGATNQVELGDFPGDTATILCHVCAHKFNAHRGQAGDAFTRKMGPASPSTAPSVARWAFPCPTCGAEVSAPRTSKNLVCMKCLTALVVNAATESVTGAGTYTRSDAPIFDVMKARPTYVCPACGRYCRGTLNTGTSYIAFCPSDKLVFEVSHDDFTVWRKRHRQFVTEDDTPLSGLSL